MKGKGNKRGGRAETISTIISVLLLAAVAVLIIYVGIGDEPAPPSFRIEVGQPRQDGQVFHVPYAVRNVGDETAKQVMVEGKLKTAAGEESATTTFDFLPGKSKEEGVFVFTSLPSLPEIRVVGYQLP